MKTLESWLAFTFEVIILVATAAVVFVALLIGGLLAFLLFCIYILWPIQRKLGYGGIRLNTWYYRKAVGNFSYDPEDLDFAEAIRYGSICVVDGEIRLRSLNQGVHYSALDEKAECLRGKDHSPPNVDCSCGFYSFRSMVLLIESRIRISESICLMKVRLYGEMIEGAYGLRSEYQTVEKIWLPASCVHEKCRHTPRFMSTGPYPEFNSEEVSSGLYPVCNKHRREHAISYSIDELRRQLKTEVMWTRPLE